MLHEKKRNAVKRTLVKQDRTASLSVVYWSNVYSFEGGRVGREPGLPELDAEQREMGLKGPFLVTSIVCA